MYTVHIQHICIICAFLMNISIINYCYYRIYTLHYTTFLWRCCFDFWKTLSSYSVRPGPEIHTSNPGCHWTIGPQTMKSRSPKRRNYTTKLQIRQVICTKSIHVSSENSVSQNPLVHHKKKTVRLAKYIQYQFSETPSNRGIDHIVAFVSPHSIPNQLNPKKIKQSKLKCDIGQCCDLL